MAISRKTPKRKANPHHLVKSTIGDSHACYILITCEPPSDGGEMQVEMSYEGDSDLAWYLLQGAQSHFDETSQCAESVDDSHLKLLD